MSSRIALVSRIVPYWYVLAHLKFWLLRIQRLEEPAFQIPHLFCESHICDSQNNRKKDTTMVPFCGYEFCYPTPIMDRAARSQTILESQLAAIHRIRCRITAAKGYHLGTFLRIGFPMSPGSYAPNGSRNQNSGNQILFHASQKSVSQNIGQRVPL